MKLIKKALLIILLTVIVISGLYTASSRGLLKNTPLAKINQQEIANLVQNTNQQTQILSERSGEVGSHVKNVLGTFIEENEEEPIQQRAFEYGRYLYCQQVVEDYEKTSSEERN